MDRNQHRPDRGDRILLWVCTGIAAATGLIIVVLGALRLRVYLLAPTGGEIPLTLLTERPVDGTGAGGAGGPEIVAGTHPTADVLVRSLADGTVALLAAGEALGAIVAAVVAGALAVLFASVARGRPFARSLTALSLIAGATLMLGSLIAQALSGFGRMNAASELDAVAGDVFTVGFALDPAPIALGAAVLVLAFVFRAGARLQRDTEGLV